jgi:hypothetical protein
VRCVPEWFILRVRDKAGASVKMSHFKFMTLESAAVMGHLIQTQDGHTAAVVDRSTKPPTEYGIDAAGKPFLIS